MINDYEIKSGIKRLQREIWERGLENVLEEADNDALNNIINLLLEHKHKEDAAIMETNILLGEIEKKLDRISACLICPLHR